MLKRKIVLLGSPEFRVKAIKMEDIFMKRLRLLLLCVALLIPNVVFAADGEILQTWQTSGSYLYQIWKGLDAQGAVTASGTAFRIGAWHSLTIWPNLGVDAGDTYEIDCGISGTTTAPTVWTTIQPASSSMDAVRLEPGDACEWMRVNKPTDTDDDTTIYVMAVRNR